MLPLYLHIQIAVDCKRRPALNNNREYLKGYLKDYTEKVTSKSKNGMYVCPICHSGEGKKGTGAFSIKDTSWHCFSCGAGGDIFDLVGAVENLPDHSQQYKRVSELYGMYQNQDRNEQYTHNNIHTSVYTPTHKEEQKTVDFTEYLLQAHSTVNQTTYWQERGISQQTVDRFKLGYDTQSQRAVIPITKNCYKARAVKPEVQPKYLIPKGAQTAIFNGKALKTAARPIFVVEGEIDALSIIEAGGEAVALGSTNNIRKLLQALEEHKPEQCLIVAMDNDTAGEKASADLLKNLQEREIQCFQYNISAGCKDANEALLKDKESLVNAISEAEGIAAALDNAEENAAKENYLKTSTAHYLQSFVNGITDSVNTPYIPTGFKKLDSILDGGLYEGLYIIGAISSLGKTTIITQMADQIAQAGTDILLFSLEMARNEIISKSISRHTVQKILSSGGNMAHAKTARGITTGSRYQNYSKEEIELIHSSINEYSKYAGNIYIKEGIGDIGAAEIRQAVADHIAFTGKTPVVIVDYLQILAPYSDRATDKQNTDKAVMELKRISRDFKTAVIGISSFNRANYKEAVTMEAFKESGAIEYSSDVLFGLQLKGAGKKDFDVNEAKKKMPRDIELVILKNRNGRTGDTVGFEFYPLFNYFTEV